MDCTGVPPLSCSAFGDDWVLDINEPELCIECADPSPAIAPPVVTRHEAWAAAHVAVAARWTRGAGTCTARSVSALGTYAQALMASVLLVLMAMVACYIRLAHRHPDAMKRWVSNACRS